VNRDFFDRVNAAALSGLESLVTQWLPSGHREGREYRCGDIQGTPGKSFGINLETGKWADFGGSETGGDPISLFAAIHGLKQGEAAMRLAQELGIELPNRAATKVADVQQSSGKKANDEIVWPIPPELLNEEGSPLNPPLPPFDKGEVEEKYVPAYLYRSPEGQILYFVLRFKRRDNGKKEIRPLTLWRDQAGELRWRWKFPPAPRPLYGLALLKAHPESTVLLVAGEKCADAANSVLPNYVSVTWCGGESSVSQAVWATTTPDYRETCNLRERQTPIILWPDCDSTGVRAALQVAGILGPERVRCTNRGAKARLAGKVRHRRRD